MKGRIKNKKLKDFTRKFISWPVKPGFHLLLLCPEWIIRIMSVILSWGFATFGFPWKKTCMRNLRLVYGDTKSTAELRKIAKTSMKNLVIIMHEAVLYFQNPPFYGWSAKIEGEHHLKKALAENRGILGLGSHLGNFIFLMCVLSQRGYPIYFIYKEPKDKDFKEISQWVMNSIRLNLIPLKPRSVATKRSFSVLKKKDLLWLAIDQNVREGEMGVELFGVKTSTAKGPAILASRTGAAVLPMYVKRDGWLHHTVVIKEPIPLVDTGNKEKDLYDNLKRFNSEIESQILENPWEWWWFHRRWKRSHRYEQTPEAEALLKGLKLS